MDRVTPHEIASNLSYLLTGTMPDETLLQAADQAAAQGISLTSDQIAQQALRILEDPATRPLAEVLNTFDTHTRSRAQTLLREFRGDGHVATLLTAGVSGLEALVLFAATEKVDGEALRLTRGWASGPWRAM